jgi:hypothetical protein
VEGAVGCRVELSNKYGMSMNRIKFWSAARKNSWESEAAWNLRAFERTADNLTQSPTAYLHTGKIYDITQHMTADGKLTWTAPDNQVWTILRIGHINEGRKNSPAPPEGTGGECDNLSTEGPEATLLVISDIWQTGLYKVACSMGCCSTVGNAIHRHGPPKWKANSTNAQDTICAPGYLPFLVMSSKIQKQHPVFYSTGEEPSTTFLPTSSIDEWQNWGTNKV